MAAELCAVAAAFWGVGARKTERKGGEQNEETPLVLKRARGRALGSFPALATAAARWQPTVASGVAWQGEEAPTRRKRAVEMVRRDAWGSSASRRWLGDGLERRRPEEQSRQADWRKGKVDLNAILEVSGTQL